MRKFLTVAAISFMAMNGMQARVATANELTFVGWGGASQEMFTKAVIEPFSQRTGVAVKQDVMDGNYAKIKAMVDADRVTWDVFHSDPFFPVGSCGTYAEKIDTSVVDVSHLPQKMVSECAVPIFQYAFLLVYNKDKYGANPPKTWVDFFDTEKFPGKRAMYNAAWAGTLEVPLLADGVAADKLFPLDYDRAFKKLDTLGDNLVFFDTGAQMQEMMERAEVDMVVSWSGRAYNAVKNGAKFVPVWKQPLATYDVLMVPKGSKNRDNAMKLIAEAVSPAAQSRIPDFVGYAPVNDQAAPKVDDVLKQFLITTPGHADELIVVDQAWYAKNQEEATKRFTDWISSK